MGVPFEYISNFMVQPIITDYLNASSTNKSLFLKTVNKNNKFGVKKDIIKKYTNIKEYKAI